jgi:hypothetical protein
MMRTLRNSRMSVAQIEHVAIGHSVSKAAEQLIKETRGRDVLIQLM